jgi:dephospho-CoA kinase
MIVGLTGGIGSGKSTAGDFFHELGIDIIDADEVAKKVLDDNEKAKNLFIQNFGNEFLNKDNSINRNLLRTKIFKNNDKKALLETIVHPIVREEITSFIRHSKSIYKIVMVPLIFETKSQDFYDKVIVVDCDEEKQIERASSRDGKLNQDIENIIKNQASREERLSIADEIIDNNRSIDDLKNQVIKIHQKFLGIKINE